MFDKQLSLSLVKERFTIHRFKPDTVIASQLYAEKFYNITRTIDELSIVCDSRLPLESERREEDWRCLKIEGPLDFSLTGILADISGILAREEISIFALSTYDTDYILVKSDQLEDACKALENAGHHILPEATSCC